MTDCVNGGDDFEAVNAISSKPKASSSKSIGNSKIGIRTGSTCDIRQYLQGDNVASPAFLEKRTSFTNNATNSSTSKYQSCNNYSEPDLFNVDLCDTETDEKSLVSALFRNILKL